MNKSLTKTPVKEQNPKIRATNFEEVCMGYTDSEAILEADRCLNCKNPRCVKGCPVGIHIPQFIQKIKENDLKGAADEIALTSSLPAICGRVCPQETQCEGMCIRGIKGESVAIGKLERYVADWARTHNYNASKVSKPNGKKIAVIGSGPSGLTCAGDLAKLGYDVTIFEAFHKPGGVLIYGIPEFRLPKDGVVIPEIENVKKLGVKFEMNVVVGRSITVDELLYDEGYDAVFLGTGAGLPKFMNIPGESANGVYSANEFLTRNNLMKAFEHDSDTPIKCGKRVVVVGGGNVAMDAARTALRLGAETHIVYRRSENELPARREEIHHAKQEGIIFDLLQNPIEILTDKNDNVCGIKIQRMQLGEADATGRRRPVAIPGDIYELECDTVIMSLGTSPNPLISSTTVGLESDQWGCIVAKEKNGETSKKGVYAGGDAVTGAATVILAMGAGKAAANGIDEYLKAKDIANKNKFLKLARARFSCRKFDSTAIEDEKLNIILEAAKLAPTALNNQPQKIYLLKSEKALQNAAKLTACTYGAPVIALITYDKTKVFTYPNKNYNSGIEDATIVATHMMLAAESEGISSCFINRFNPDEAKEIFELPKNEIPVMLLDFGYKGEGSLPTPRHFASKEISEFVEYK